MKGHLRIARPTDQLERVAEMYRSGLGFEILGRFEDHEGFDGVMLGHPGGGYHLEFTRHRGHHAGRAPTRDNLLVFYEPDAIVWKEACSRMRQAGFLEVDSYNPYWNREGKCFEDPDGYRVVLQNTEWK